MPSFPDGTRVWIDVNGEPLTEYEKEVEKWTQNNGRGEEEQQHRVTVRIAVKKNQVFAKGIHLAKKEADKSDRKTTFKLLPEHYSQYDTRKPEELGQKWMIERYKKHHWKPGKLVFGPMDVCRCRSRTMVSSRIEFEFAESTGLRRNRGSIKYIARFIYHPAALLIKEGVMRDPDLAIQDEEVGSDVKPNKRRRRDSAEAQASTSAGAAAAATAQERKQRIKAQLWDVRQQQRSLEAELLEVQQELGEGGGGDQVNAERSAPAGSTSRVPWKRELDPVAFASFYPLSDSDDE